MIISFYGVFHAEWMSLLADPADVSPGFIRLGTITGPY